MGKVHSFVVAIPARHASTRLPGKPLQLIGAEPMVLHVARRALAAGAGEVVVATDDARVADALRGQPVRVVMTRADHASGSDRLAEAAGLCGWDDETIVVNLQGDEPLAPPAGIRAVAEALAGSDAAMATLAAPIDDAGDLFNPNCVKVVLDQSGNALYFSRAPLPWAREAFAFSREHVPEGVAYLRHIGIYAYRAGFLRRFARLPPTPLERAESLEQLRALEHGYRIAVRMTPEAFPGGVDTPEDLERVRKLVGG
jgi:3-deoxy-manno-octulosonate cytidylyltransferase (CMP-KDO synthetase)